MQPRKTPSSPHRLSTARSSFPFSESCATISLVPDPQSPRPTFDSNEIRRCISLCFSPKDLRTFAENLGIPNLGPWDRGIQDGAREVVRHYERLGTLDELVAKLAEARPLMEWPAPLANTAPITPAPVAPEPAAPTIPLAETNPAPSADPAPFAPRVISAANTAPPAAPVKPTVSPTLPASEPVIRDPFAPAWPGTAAPSGATNSKNLEGRKLAPILAAGVVLITIITIGIFLAVRVGKNPDSVAPEIVGGRPLRPNGPARMSAEAMKKSLESLARGCDLDLPKNAEIDISLFSAAYAQCGTRAGLAVPPLGSRVDKPRSFDAAPPTDDPSDAALNAPGANTPRQTNPGRDATPRPAPAPAPAPDPKKSAAADGCVEKCAATQRQCNRACGSEPTSSSQYDRWQGCQTQCLSTASKCRLACQ